MNQHKLEIECTEIIERCVDVTCEDHEELCVTAKTLAVGAERSGVALEIAVTAVAADGALEEEAVVFPAERWEDIKRMGDAAIAAYREKFAGPS